MLQTWGPAAKPEPLNKGGIVKGAIPTMKMQAEGEWKDSQGKLSASIVSLDYKKYNDNDEYNTMMIVLTSSLMLFSI